MGSGDWFKTIINSKKVKGSSASSKSNGFKWKKHSGKQQSSSFANARALGMPVEDIAATRIQTAFRAYMARKSLRRLKGIVRFQAVTQRHSVKKQASNTLSNIHAWSRIQGEIRARRVNMVMEGQLKQKKLEHQLKLEAKLHDLEVEWSGGSETKGEILSRIHQREEASIKRERAMAYAFSHQWRANSNPLGFSKYELGKSDWGWSWKERWIAARPWESHVASKLISPKKVQHAQANKVGENIKSPFKSKSPKKVQQGRADKVDKNINSPSESKSPKKVQHRQASKVGKNINSPTQKSSGSVKPPMSYGRGTTVGRRLSLPAAEKPSLGQNAKAEVTITKENTTKGQRLSFPASKKPSPGGNTEARKTNTKEITMKDQRLSFPAAEKQFPLKAKPYLKKQSPRRNRFPNTLPILFSEW